MMIALIVSTNIVLLFLPIECHVIAEFDVSTEDNRMMGNVLHQAEILAKDFGEKIETKLGRSYELLGHKIAEIGSQLDENRNNLADQATDLYAGPLANQTSLIYENLQYNSGKVGDGLSSILHWLGENVIKVGHNTGLLISSGFHTMGDLIGAMIDKTEDLVGTGLIQDSEKIHSAAIELQRTSHQNSENLRNEIRETAPKFHQILTNILRKFGDKLHHFGLDTQTGGKILEEHHFLDTFKRAYRH